MVLACQTGWDAPPRIKDAPGGLQSWAKSVGMIPVPAQLSQSRFYPEANYPALLAFWENFNPSTRVPSRTGNAGARDRRLSFLIKLSTLTELHQRRLFLPNTKSRSEESQPI